MSGEVFNNPTVKNVVFEIKFPNLFSIENKIGDYQERIISEFPESKLLLRRPIIISDVGPEGKLESIPDSPQKNFEKKIWHFESEEKHEVNITTNSLMIRSSHHKTYRNITSEKKFRDVIEFVVTNFFEIISIPRLNRIGLLYQDKCPLPNKNNETFTRFYNSAFRTDRYPIDDVINMACEIRTKRGNHFLIYRETLVENSGKYSVLLDFDGYETNVPSQQYLQVTDELHEIIDKEYFSIIQDPVIEHMRRE